MPGAEEHIPYASVTNRRAHDFRPTIASHAMLIDSLDAVRPNKKQKLAPCRSSTAFKPTMARPNAVDHTSQTRKSAAVHSVVCHHTEETTQGNIQLQRFNLTGQLAANNPALCKELRNQSCHRMH